MHTLLPIFILSSYYLVPLSIFFFFNDPATPEISTLPLPDALRIFAFDVGPVPVAVHHCGPAPHDLAGLAVRDVVAVGIAHPHLHEWSIPTATPSRTARPARS